MKNVWMRKWIFLWRCCLNNFIHTDWKCSKWSVLWICHLSIYAYSIYNIHHLKEERKTKGKVMSRNGSEGNCSTCSWINIQGSLTQVGLAFLGCVSKKEQTRNERGSFFTYTLIGQCSLSAILFGTWLPAFYLVLADSLS